MSYNDALSIMFALALTVLCLVVFLASWTLDYGPAIVAFVFGGLGFIASGAWFIMVLAS